ncbi:MAG: S41 family peptidase [Bacteroidales bacterium]|nr:S41 family peptidase [Candidatus Physcousia equi]
MTQARCLSPLHILLPLLFSLLSCSACLRGVEASRTPEDNFRALWTLIDEHYCFLDYKRETLGVDWAEVYGRYHAQLSPAMQPIQLFEVLSHMLSELRDGHVNLYCSADVGRNWSWREDYPENLDRELRDAYLGTDYRIASGLKYRILPDNIGYIVYESFSNAVGEGNIDDCLYYLRSCNGLIIDVRGNTGGQLDNAQRLSSHFTNERRLVGYMTHKTGKAHNAFSAPQPEYINPSTGIRWQKRCVVLTNRSCYSATNAFVRNMKECPLVTVMGDQTGGGSGLPFTSELPNGWVVRFSACPMYDARMEHTEFGIAPDIPLALDIEAAQHGSDSMIDYARAWLLK